MEQQTIYPITKITDWSEESIIKEWRQGTEIAQLTQMYISYCRGILKKKILKNEARGYIENVIYRYQKRGWVI